MPEIRQRVPGGRIQSPNSVSNTSVKPPGLHGEDAARMALLLQHPAVGVEQRAAQRTGAPVDGDQVTGASAHAPSQPRGL